MPTKIFVLAVLEGLIVHSEGERYLDWYFLLGENKEDCSFGVLLDFLDSIVLLSVGQNERLIEITV